MHFLAMTNDVLTALPLETVPPASTDGGTGTAPGFAGTLITNARVILIAALGILVLVASCAALISGGIKGKMRKSIDVTGAVLIGLIPAGIFLAGSVILVSTGVVKLSGF